MEQKPQKGRETDITGILVIVCVVLVGALIARTSLDFTKTKTSTSSRASEPTQNKLINCKDKSNLKPNASGYDTSKDECDTYPDYKKNFKMDFLSGKCKNPISYCKRYGDVSLLGDAHCRNINKNESGGMCSSSDTVKDMKKTDSVCQVVDGSNLKEGRCFYHMVTVPTKALAPTPMDGFKASSCGSAKINCSSLFKYTSGGRGDGKNGVSSRGEGVSPRNTLDLSSRTAIDQIACVFSSTQVPQGSDIDKMKCAFLISGNFKACNGIQFAHTGSTCYKSSNSSSTGSFYDWTSGKWIDSSFCEITVQSNITTHSKCKEKAGGDSTTK